MTSYKPAIPAPTDIQAQSQADIQSNFEKLNVDFSIDHTPYTSSTDSGFHTKVSVADALGADPGLANPKSSVYTKTIGSLSELFFQNDVNATDVKQLTGFEVPSDVSDANPDISGGTYKFYELPWGWRCYFGLTDTVPSGFNYAVSLSANPAKSNVLLTQATAVNVVSAYQFLSITTAGFTLRRTTGSASAIRWAFITT